MKDVKKREKASDYFKKELFSKIKLTNEECLKAADTFRDAFSNYYLIDFLLMNKRNDKKVIDYFKVELTTNNETSIFLSDSEDFNSFAILQPDHCMAPGFFAYLFGGGLQLIKDNGIKCVFHMLEYSDYIAVYRKKLAGENSWYLYYLGTKQQSQGKGYGSKILKNITSYMDEIGKELYLETNDIKDTAYYKKFGFEQIGEFKFADFTGYCMLRKPIQKN